MSASHLDIAPRHAGVVFGVGNTAGTLAGLVAVPAMGYILQTLHSWPITFGIAAVHNVVGAAIWSQWAGDRPLPEDGPAQELNAVMQPVVEDVPAGLQSHGMEERGQRDSLEENSSIVSSGVGQQPIYVGVAGVAA
jgi:MFS family permease